MAAVFVPPSPQTALAMSNRRAPLANVPNAANSPHRPGPLAAKRRSQIDIPYGQPPPKKQLLERDETDSRSPTKSRASAFPNPDTKLFSRRPNNVQPTAFEKKLVAAKDRERQSQVKGSRNEKPSAETLDTIRQWQKHYRKAFPQFVFYFDSIPEDVRYKCSRQCMALGASEEKFFSRLVTHVVTSRPIPPETESTSPTETPAAPEIEQHSLEGPLQTVNPSLLEKNSDPNALLLSRSRHAQDRRPEFDLRREGGNMDVLHRARQMGMKIWALEKLQRMITAINDGDTASHGHFTRSHNGGVSSRARGDAELSQVLRNELINGPSDRDPASWAKDMIPFKGPFIYVHDMDERTRPVMVREYPKVAKRQDGAWPQFRSAPLGKCPFIDEPLSKKELARLKEKEKKISTKQDTNTLKELQDVKATIVPEEKVWDNKEEDSASALKVEAGISALDVIEAQNNIATVQTHLPRKSSESFIAPTLTRTGPFHLGREPAASGVQPSNITSAIRSQMLSSTAAAPGAKAGVSKEVHELKRKVLERGSGLVSTSTVPSSHRPTDASQSGKSVTNTSIRNTKYKPGEKIGQKLDEGMQSEDNANSKLRAGNHKGDTLKKATEKRRDPKPGYCENCRDKFDDFDEHVMTRKHRKFATTMSNWVELDALLYQLQRPLKEEFECV